MRTWLAVPLLAGACGGPAARPAASEPMIASMAELGLMMKDDINPPFSRLSFLLFHGSEVEADPSALATELERNALALRQALARLRSLPRVPTRTDEGRAVFVTYAESVERSTARLLRAVAEGDQSGAASELARIADTCNNCHHFFRLKIEDSAVPRTGPAESDVGVALSPAGRPPTSPNLE